MCSAQRGVLSVDEGIVFLAVLFGMRKGDFDVFAFEMNDRVERVVVHAVGEEVAQAGARQDSPAVEHDCQARVEVSVVAEHDLDELAAKSVVLEE